MANIVLVDDEICILEGMAKLIAHIGPQYTVLAKFFNSSEALAFLKKHYAEVDMLITDIQMDGMNGLELVEQIHKLNPALPCVILTGYEEFAYAKAAVSLGVVSYLLKPVDTSELTQTLERLILQKQEEAPNIFARRKLSCEVTYIKRAIETHCADFDLNAAADHLLLSKDYISRLFKKETGITLMDYLIRVRLEKAKELLREPRQYKVYEICRMVGYENNAYFSRLFRNSVGMTPREYRQSLPKGSEEEKR